MSSLYNLEPQPTAQVLLETTSGDILLELFAKQTPLTSRNFIQLCLDGYYTGTIFHRLVPGFVIQGGDPTGTGEGGEAIYDGGLFEDEFHSRLKFNRRGLLGMANSGRKNDNGSQFFMTLGATPELEGMNTMFGRVVGDTIYNLMKLGEADLAQEQGERPLYPTKITGTEVLVNPFEDLVSRKGKGEVRIELKKRKAEKKKGKKKGGKALLSFGLEDGEEDAGAPVLKREKFNSKLVTGNGTGLAQGQAKQTSEPGAKPAEKAIRRRDSRSASPAAILMPERELQLPLPDAEEPALSRSSTPEPPVIAKVSTLLERTNAQIAEMKASMKRNVSSAPKEQLRKKSALEEMIPDNATRGRKRKHGVNGNASNDVQTMDLLKAFRVKLERAPPEVESSQSPSQPISHSQDPLPSHDSGNGAPEEEAELCDLHFIANCQSCQSWDKHMSENVQAEEDDGKGWMSHSLSFEKDRLGKDLKWKKKNEEELVVIDPREKTKDLMEERRAKRMARSGGNRSKAWDKDRERGRLPERRVGEKG